MSKVSDRVTAFVCFTRLCIDVNYIFVRFFEKIYAINSHCTCFTSSPVDNSRIFSCETSFARILAVISVLFVFKQVPGIIFTILFCRHIHFKPHKYIRFVLFLLLYWICWLISGMNRHKLYNLRLFTKSTVFGGVHLNFS